MSARLIVSTFPGTPGAPTPVRTWIGGDSVKDLVETIDSYVEDGYSTSDLFIEGVTDGTQRRLTSAEYEAVCDIVDRIKEFGTLDTDQYTVEILEALDLLAP